MRARAAILGICLAAAGAGCGDGDGGGPGGGGGQASCTLSAGTALAICEEATGLTAAQVTQLQQDCTASNGGGTTATFANGPCSHVNALGGCRLDVGPGQTATVWYYANGGLTGADIQMLCTSAGAAFVAP